MTANRPDGTNRGRRDVKPVPGYEDLWPHIAVLDKPGAPDHGEQIIPVRTLSLMIAPSVEVFHTEWARQTGLIALGQLARYTLPREWQAGARRRSNELMARYNTEAGFEVLRGLHREYGVFPPDPLP
ncbi:hypothetical protein Ssi03_76360 [Sphaerisporangium siamense]|uniref:Uncharacterized protein n=1 Tax=Sphaerisporangium siamense TaxID=795645 RepID=A0A7W7D2Z1_9ACTN|nr:hypothetical protein [Sphaerisporangium siamense]MBB4699317.1 hypothetical protein [Sphaerisporangium siamense]GII89646.1 hypothetical protein Ssi03_76360 [Sphaerisporangium siamense]